MFAKENNEYFYKISGSETGERKSYVRQKIYIIGTNSKIDGDSYNRKDVDGVNDFFSAEEPFYRLALGTSCIGSLIIA